MWVAVLGVPVGLNIPCLIYDTRLCEIDGKMTIARKVTRYKYKICYRCKNRRTYNKPEANISSCFVTSLSLPKGIKETSL